MNETATVFPVMAGQRRLVDFMRLLRRARYRQLAIEHACAGLFLGLSLAAVVLLWARLAPVQHDPLMVLAGCVVGALVLAFATLIFRRPGDLWLAIITDVRLRLKQKLSTAVEVLERHPGHPLTARLVAQALNARLPPRVQHVFPLSLSVWGKLMPLAAAAVVFALTIEVGTTAASQPRFVDPAVSEEGVRLRAFAGLMARRAKRDALPLSAARARDIRQLGAQMAAGALSRKEALSRLAQLTEKVREAKRVALQDAPLTPAPPLDVRYQDHNSWDAANQALISQLASGNRDPAALAAVAADNAALGQWGLTFEEMERALQSAAAGHPEAMRELLREVRRHQHSAREASNLTEAQARLTQSRQALGGGQDRETVSGSGRTEGRQQGLTDDARDAANTGDMMGEEGSAHGAAEGAAPGRGNAVAKPTSATTITELPAVDGGELLKPQARYSDGQVFQSRAQALPRLTSPTLGVADVSGPLRAQLEAVLSKEHLPAHRKAVIRRYFLSLSQGTAAVGGDSASP